jgi:hypothetical protein
MRFIALLFLLVIFNIACSLDKTTQKNTKNESSKSVENSASNNIKSDANNTGVISDKEANDKERMTSIKDTLGLITLSDKYPSGKNEIKDKNDFIRFYNEDGSLWYEFTFYYDDSDGEFEYQNDNFRAFAFHPDHFLLSLMCVGEDKNRYQVVVNEEPELKKYVKKSDDNLKLESWSEHILKTFSIDLEKGKNTIFETPDGKEIKPDLEAMDRFEAVEVKGDWLKVKWEISGKSKENKTGWVRWKKDDVILISWFYFA